MGPRPFRRGNKWKDSLRSLRAKLQWGHALSGVETPGKNARTTNVRLASMGPRPFRRGNNLIASNRPATRTLCEHSQLRLYPIHELESTFPSSQEPSRP